MSLKIKNYLLTGPFAIEDAMIRPNQNPVVYAIVDKAGEPWNPTFKVLEVGDTGEGGMRFSEHPNREVWGRAAGKVGVYLLTFDRKETGDTPARKLAIAAIEDALKATDGFIL